MKNIYIPDPCSENWEAMSPREKGRFCSSCSKCVIDFTEKQPHEIEYIFKERQDEEICGRFLNHQLNIKDEKTSLLENRFFQYIPATFRNNKVALGVISVILFLTGCSKPKETCTATTGLVLIEEDSIPSNNDYVMGEPIIQNDSVAKIHKKDSLKLKHVK
ncbi:hypothetical protein [Chryseobacterium shigense]|uniref:Uncharacterized protein n=1 Tax=Chryseobacterium shigense TaxID=297244 RepID=A0A841NMR4_9FLAO|nr:hypothetical protein [Chryseobacterium shigense]MBB6372045.1 hypothetical protein [Chryseobacterium shigense]